VCGWAARADVAAGKCSARATATSVEWLVQATSHWKFACAWESRWTEHSPFLHLLYRFLTTSRLSRLRQPIKHPKPDVKTDLALQ
jgi:hypothetical protein